MTNGQPIVWQQWIDAHNWDVETHSRQIHYKLTPSHLSSDSQGKMWNHIAEEVLNRDMLHLMKQYQRSLSNGSVLDAAVQFLEKTSIMIDVLRDKRPYYQRMTQG